MSKLSVIVTLIGLGVIAGCAPPRVLVQAQSAEAKEFNYIYFVEQEQNKDSRLKRCQLNDDNTAKCAVQFDLK